MKANYRTYAKGGIKSMKNGFEAVVVGGGFGVAGARCGSVCVAA